MGTDEETSNAAFTLARPLRVLLVPDVPYWICDTIAKAYVRYNPELDARICCGRVLRSLPDLQQYIGHFDLVHFLTPHDANKCMASFKGRIATVVTVHHVQDEANTQSVSSCDGVMTASTQWQTRLREMGVTDEKLAVVPYGVDTSVFRPRSQGERNACRSDLGLAPDVFVVGFVGKRSSDAHGRKGTDVFIRGVQRLAKTVPNLHVLIVGPGWETVASALSAQGVPCTHKPFIDGEPAFARVYAAMDVYWCTSSIEGGPVPVLEAMASGVCCLATDVGMVSDVMESDENGFVLPIDDDAAFAQQTMLLAEDGGLHDRVGAAAAHTICEHFDWSISARCVLSLYEKARANFAVRADRNTPLSGNDAGILPPWPADWIAAEEKALSARFLRDAQNPPSMLTRKLRQLIENQWVRRWLRGAEKARLT